VLSEAASVAVDEVVDGLISTGCDRSPVDRNAASNIGRSTSDFAGGVLDDCISSERLSAVLRNKVNRGVSLAPYSFKSWIYADHNSSNNNS
jgi:hypothetical protein